MYSQKLRMKSGPSGPGIVKSVTASCAANPLHVVSASARRSSPLRQRCPDALDDLYEWSSTSESLGAFALADVPLYAAVGRSGVHNPANFNTSTPSISEANVASICGNSDLRVLTCGYCGGPTLSSEPGVTDHCCAELGEGYVKQFPWAAGLLYRNFLRTRHRFEERKVAQEEEEKPVEAAVMYPPPDPAPTGLGYLSVGPAVEISDDKELDNNDYTQLLGGAGVGQLEVVTELDEPEQAAAPASAFAPASVPASAARTGAKKRGAALQEQPAAGAACGGDGGGMTEDMRPVPQKRARGAVAAPAVAAKTESPHRSTGCTDEMDRYFALAAAEMARDDATYSFANILASWSLKKGDKALAAAPLAVQQCYRLLVDAGTTATPVACKFAVTMLQKFEHQGPAKQWSLQLPGTTLPLSKALFDMKMDARKHFVQDVLHVDGVRAPTQKELSRDQAVRILRAISQLFKDQLKLHGDHLSVDALRQWGLAFPATRE